MQNAEIERILRACLPEDFAIYTGVKINGCQIDAIAVSPMYGVITVNVLDIEFDRRHKPKATELFNRDNTLAKTLFIPKITRISSCRAETIPTGPSFDSGMLSLNVIHCDEWNAFKKHAADHNWEQQHLFFSEEEFQEEFKRLAVRFIQANENGRNQKSIDWVTKRANLWLTRAPGGIKVPILNLNKRQLELIEDDQIQPRGPRYRRIRGTAGSGKTLVLVERAVRLLMQGKSVCCLTYNITAAVYLQDLIATSLARNGKTFCSVRERFLCMHFHGFCGFVLPRRIQGLTRERTSEEFDVKWPQDVLACLKKQGGHTYDAIMVDEGQDWCTGWWDVVHELLKPNGEVLMAADVTQDIYGRTVEMGQNWCGTHFRGRWVSLEGSYRLPLDLIEPLRDFGSRFLPGEPDLPISVQGHFEGFARTNLTWIQLPETTPNLTVANLVRNQVMRLTAPKRLGGENIDPSAITCLTERHGLGLDIESALVACGYDVCSAISDKESKQSFHFEANAIKLTTVKSFKGLESRTIVVVIETPSNLEQGRGIDYAAQIYVAMSRVKVSLESQLIVICKDPRYLDYGRTWPRYGGAFTDYSNVSPADVPSESLLLAKKGKTPDELFLSQTLLALVGRFDCRTLQDSVNPLKVDSNVHNTGSQNVEYLHEYFLRSFTENYLLFKRTLETPAILRHFQCQPVIRVLAYGAGTGGDVLGTLAALADVGIAGKRLSVVAIDGNEDALNKCAEIIRMAAPHLKNEVNVETISHEIQLQEQDKFGVEKLGGSVFDIIQTSKMFNELVGRNSRIIYQYLTDVVQRHLQSGGLALLLDVSVRREVTLRRQKSIQWVSCLLATQTAKFVQDHTDYEILLPTLCHGCREAVERDCYTAKVFSFRRHETDRYATDSVICCRLLAKSNTYRASARIPKESSDFITIYRQRGDVECCKSRGYPMIDGYLLMNK